MIALDQIGFGQSDKPLANYHTGMLAEFLARFLAAIGITKASLVGNSIGASVALYKAVHYPQPSTGWCLPTVRASEGKGPRRPRRPTPTSGTFRTA